ncbi:hypothetical protein D3C76_614590 [compost metagenome]
METDSRLIGQRFKVKALIKNDHAMIIFTVLEIKKQAFLLQESEYKIEVRLLILRAITDRF